MGIYARHNDEWYRVDGGGGSAGADLVGGVAGWASIDSVSGTADLTTLQDNDIAPQSATEDPEVPGTYNVVENGVEWRVAVFTTSGGKVNTSGGLVDAFLIGGGSMSGANAMPGSVKDGLHDLPAGSLDITVGAGSTGGGTSQLRIGGSSAIGTVLWTQPHGEAGDAAQAQGAGAAKDVPDITWEQKTPYTTSITGSSASYGNMGNEESSTTYGDPTKNGIVVVRSPKDATSNKAPDAPVAWGKFGNVTDYDATGDWKDEKGRMWKWYEFNVAGDRTIDLTGGMYWVLCVGGGAAETLNTEYKWSGQPGLVNEGYWEFGDGETPITVGAKGFAMGEISALGLPSSIGDFETQGVVSWGNDAVGRGSTTYGDKTGYSSFITGSERKFATGYDGDEVPGRGSYRGHQAKDGCVIIAAVVNEPNDWNQPGSLPGIGGWATITDVKGKGTKYSYGDWVAFEWTDDGELTTQAGGLVDALVVGGGGPAVSTTGHGAGGYMVDGIRTVSTTSSIVIGKGGSHTGWDSSDALTKARATSLGDIEAGGGGHTAAGPSGDGTSSEPWNGVYSTIADGSTPVLYAPNGKSTIAAPGRGANNVSTRKAQDGVVIVRVPKANYMGNLPDGAFDVPTTRQAIVEAVEEKVENVKDTMIIDGRERKIKRNRKR